MRANLLLTAGFGLARAAINLDGSPAVAPAGPGDPSPVGDINEYVPERHDCPLPCAGQDITDMNTWIRYHSLQRLERCGKPMLMQLSVYKPLDDALTDVVIHTCTLGEGGEMAPFKLKPRHASKHRKRDPQLHTSPLEMAQACKNAGSPTDATVQVFSSGSTTGGGQAPDHEATILLQGIKAFFGAAENCNENFLFARLNHTIAGVFVGERIGKQTVDSVMQPLSEHLRSGGLGLNHTISQVCGGEGDPDTVLGIAFNVVGNLGAVQKTLADWGKGIFNGTIFSRMANKRATCRWIEVESGNGCDVLAKRCGISGADFTKYNPKPGLCSGLRPGDFVCCSAGDPYVPPAPPKPSPNADGSCKVHDIVQNDTCDSLAKKYGITVDDIESWNRKRTWAWLDCAGMQWGYNMCVSPGSPPLPRQQEGVQCGPMKPGTTAADPRGSGQGLADLNPCPLKACCSNWGYCGVFSMHCDIHAPPNAGPGAKLPGHQNTCVSNCGMELKSNSDPPAKFSRIGYYESFNYDRDCLWLKAKNANTDGSYTHMHWAFGDIDKSSWKVVINDTHKQWADFKKLPLKRIVSLGGWAYSTEAPHAYTLRSAIIDNRDTFTTNIAEFVKNEGIDGIDIDWEYPGAPDIEANGQILGKQTDGADYLSFLRLLRRKLPSGASLSIAAPASFWYLKAFPIDRMAAPGLLDYIVYMTYDLHGQWDYGKPNSFDSCPSGKCIRSHVNLTETRNMLTMIMKAGVPGNKIFVGEASYGRSFRMAKDGCWGEMCEFTGSSTVSDAAPGRCTATGGYLGYAEVLEIIARGDGAKVFYDERSSSDVMLYEGDYIGYLTPDSKEKRRDDWKALNFAGSVDWAVDLQSFSNDDMNKYPDGDQQAEGDGCIYGVDDTVNTAKLCEFTCTLGYCPASYCSCVEVGKLRPYPPTISNGNDIIAEDTNSLDLGRMCNFACRFGYCPENVCVVIPPEPVDEEDFVTVKDETHMSDACYIFRRPEERDLSVIMCEEFCRSQVNAAKAEGRTTNVGCISRQPLTEKSVWEEDPSLGQFKRGKCFCDNWLLNEVVDTILEALPAIAQIGCFIMLNSLKTVVEVGLQFIPGVGQVLDAALAPDMALTAADIINTIYPQGEEPGGAWENWVSSACGGTDLVPEDLKKAFEILSMATDLVGRGSRVPKNIKDKHGGKGKKGDEGNPRSPKQPPPGKNSNNRSQRKCNVRDPVKKISHHTRRSASCSNDIEVRKETIITSIAWAPNAVATQIKGECSLEHKHACYHYSSALRYNPAWSTLSCPTAAASSKKVRLNGPAVRAWSAQHNGAGWQKEVTKLDPKIICQRDEYPPVYLLDKGDTAYVNGGKANMGGQAIRLIPNTDNSGAAEEFAHVCFKPQCEELKENDFAPLLRAAGTSRTINGVATKGIDGVKTKVDQTFFVATMNKRPEFTWTRWGHAANPAPSDGLRLNPCWPSGLAPNDPGYALLTWDPFYGGKAPPYDYKTRVTATPMPTRKVTFVRATRTVEVTAPPVTSMPEVTEVPDYSSCEPEDMDY
ncbi:hypothetical protein QBC34DRAFT_465261 [Podospora aff. communis PSN243]|uniref:chitinase n=1 Tax=Podospora aff. communis PSN243 TaxID=3040156 RepID=A0AAV9H6R9_9PEZI|nr:hypothetical protein QBC34DRAFT_465261 [Podospora aff. communis PSN243]